MSHYNFKKIVVVPTAKVNNLIAVTDEGLAALNVCFLCRRISLTLSCLKLNAKLQQWSTNSTKSHAFVGFTCVKSSLPSKVSTTSFQQSWQISRNWKTFTHSMLILWMSCTTKITTNWLLGRSTLLYTWLTMSQRITCVFSNTETLSTGANSWKELLLEEWPPLWCASARAWNIWNKSASIFPGCLQLTQTHAHCLSAASQMLESQASSTRSPELM